jgi:hypothetical protein
MYAILCCGIACLLIGSATTSLVAAEPIVVAGGEGREAPKQPQAAVSADGTVDLVYGADDHVVHCRSTDGGTSFGLPKSAFRVANLSLGMRRGPRVITTHDALVVTAIGGPEGRGRDGDLQAWRSSDGGDTWQGPVRVNDSANSAREGLHGMAAGADGSIWCVWLDLRHDRSEVYGSRSTDGGETWQSNSRIYHSPDGNVCECCHPSVLVHGQNIHVLFRNSLAGHRDMYLASSKDGGITFLPAKKLGQGRWKLNACPMDGGMLAAGRDGTPITVWRRDGEIFTATGGKEQSLGRGEQPWAAASLVGSVIVWTAGREGDLIYFNPAAKQPQKIANHARDPVVASPLNGDGPVIACWETKHDGKSVVMATRLDISKTKSR